MKNILLIGLGRFGRHTAMKLNELGHQVMAVDRDEKKVDAVVSYVTNAMIGDSTNPDFLATLGIENFDVEGISNSPAIFDEVKMKWLNGRYIKEMDEDEFMEYALPFFEQSKIKGKYDYKKFAALLKDRIEIFSEIPDMVAFIEEFGDYDLALFDHKKMKTNADVAKVCLKEALGIFENSETFDAQELHDKMIARCEELGMKKGQMLFTVRVGLTGCASTPGGAVEMADILGKDESVRRLKYSLKLLGE